MMTVKRVKNQGKNYATVTATFQVILLKALIAVGFSCLRLITAHPAFFYFSFRLTCEGKNVQQEPKGIVFLSKLLLLFQYCHLCFATSPHISVSQTGTMITIKTTCSMCQGSYVWQSQPYLLGRFPAGNLLLSFAILCAGASVYKVLLVFKHMGMLVYSQPTYYYHQRHLLIPSIMKFWRNYQAQILEKLNGKEVVLAGDGRHDSMGHSAKYGTYTIFCCTVGLIIHIVLIQVPEISISITNSNFISITLQNPQITPCFFVDNTTIACFTM